MTDGSITGARDAERDATGYADLVAEVEAIEAAVDESTPYEVRQEVVALRNKIERPPLKQDASNEHNSFEVRKAGVDNVREIAQDLVAKL